MECLDVLNRWDIADARQLLAPFWDASVATLPSQRPDFLTPEQIWAEREYAGLPASLDPQLAEVAERVAVSEDLRLLAWHCERLVYDELDYDVARCCRDWPQVIGPLSEDTGLLYLLIGLAAIPRMRAFHQAHSVPDEITRATCSHFTASLGRYRLQHEGRDGFGTYALYWLRNHTTGKLYCLGRLEFMLKPFGGALTAWRHRVSGNVIALSADDLVFDTEGLVTDPDTAHGSRTRFTETADIISGHPISPSGFIQPEAVCLQRAQWQRVLAPGDSIHEVHIPDGGGMTMAACQASMQRATEFFPRHFPDQTSVGFACASWILNPQLAQIYHPGSSMVLWQRELYLYPINSGDRSGLFFVFGTDNIDPETGPRDTSLRRAMLDHMASGGRLIGGGMFLMLEDFKNFGEQIYRQAWPLDLDHIQGISS